MSSGMLSKLASASAADVLSLLIAIGRKWEQDA
jgi:hypothetical protein